ncbi:MAG: hypothetical protein HYX89_02065 [Chloroflexi bacterium]|nr:hypothetical protein [Chloroflexota bacterium]
MKGTDRLLVGLLVGIGLILVASFVVLILVQGRPQETFPPGSPEDVVQRYFRAVNDEDWRTAYDLLASSVKARVSFEEFRSRSGGPQPVEQSQRALLQRSVVRGNDADVTLLVTTFSADRPGSFNEFSRTVTFALVREDGEWHILTGPDQVPFAGNIYPLTRFGEPFPPPPVPAVPPTPTSTPAR